MGLICRSKSIGRHTTTMHLFFSFSRRMFSLDASRTFSPSLTAHLPFPEISIAPAKPREQAKAQKEFIELKPKQAYPTPFSLAVVLVMSIGKKGESL